MNTACGTCWTELACFTVVLCIMNIQVLVLFGVDGGQGNFCLGHGGWPFTCTCPLGHCVILGGVVEGVGVGVVVLLLLLLVLSGVVVFGNCIGLILIVSVGLVVVVVSVPLVFGTWIWVAAKAGEAINSSGVSATKNTRLFIPWYTRPDYFPFVFWVCDCY